MDNDYTSPLKILLYNSNQDYSTSKSISSGKKGLYSNSNSRSKHIRKTNNPHFEKKVSKNDKLSNSICKRLTLDILCENLQLGKSLNLIENSNVKNLVNQIYANKNEKPDKGNANMINGIPVEIFLKNEEKKIRNRVFTAYKDRCDPKVKKQVNTNIILREVSCMMNENRKLTNIIKRKVEEQKNYYNRLNNSYL